MFDINKKKIIIFIFLINNYLTCLPNNMNIEDVKIKWSKAQKEFEQYSDEINIGTTNYIEYRVTLAFDSKVPLKDIEAHITKEKDDYFSIEVPTVKIRRFEVSKNNKFKKYAKKYILDFTIRRGDQATQFEHITAILNVSYKNTIFKTLRKIKKLKVDTK